MLKLALTSDKAIGLEVAIYNPDRDSDGKAGRLLTDILVGALEFARAPAASPQ